MKSRDGVKRRGYDSSRRREQAAQTRSAIVFAARDLFVEQGYARTTVADVARRADVSVETIYAGFGNKAALLHRAWDVTIGGDDTEITFHERPEILAIRAEPDAAKRLRLHAVEATKAAERTAPFQLMVLAAAGADPTAADMLEEIGRQRLTGMGVMASELAATGQLRVEVDECRDVLWSTTDGMLWHRLVPGRGWTNDRFARWLGDLWVDLFVDPKAQKTRRRKPSA
jgi:AcrR family transcriptional regulator